MAQYYQISFDQLKQLFPELPATVGDENVQYAIVNQGQEVQLNNIQIGNYQVQEDLRQGSISSNCISVVKAENLNGQYSIALKDDMPDQNNIYVIESVNPTSNPTSVQLQNNHSLQANHHQQIPTDSLSSNHLQTIYIAASPTQQVVPPVTYISVQPEDVNEFSESSQVITEHSAEINEPSHGTEEVQGPLISKSLSVNNETLILPEAKELEESEDIAQGSVLSSAQVQSVQTRYSLNRSTSQTEIKLPSTQLVALNVPSTASPVNQVRHIQSNSQLSTTQVSLPNGQQISLQEYRRMNPQINSTPNCRGCNRGGTVVRQSRGRQGSRRGSSAHSPIRLASPATNLTPGRVIVLDQREGEPMQFVFRNDSDQEQQSAQLTGQQGSNTGLHLSQYVQSDEHRQVVMLVPSSSVGGEHQMVAVAVPASEVNSNVPIVATVENSTRQRTPKNKFVSSASTAVLNSGPKRSIGLDGVVEQTNPGNFSTTTPLSKRNLEERKLVPGMIALCQYCGYHSEDFNRCDRCRRKLPVNCKEMSVSHSKVVMDGIPSQKFYKVMQEGGDRMQKQERLTRVRKPRKQFEEPVILTISSDEDEDADGKQDPSARETVANHLETENGAIVGLNPVSESILPPISFTAFEKEPVIKDDECDGHDAEEDSSIAEAIAAEVRDLQSRAMEVTNENRPIYLSCRTVRIGSYKAVPRERVLICRQGIQICVPDIDDATKSVTITFGLKDVVKALIHFGRAMPVIFLYTTYNSGVRIRSSLNMSSGRSLYYDPCSVEETQRRITLLPERMTDDSRTRLKAIFSSRGLLVELDNKEANDILVRASPKEVQETIKKSSNTPAPTGVNKPLKDYFQKILIYPPPPAKGGITINPEDYCCLGEDQFLNDVIIDFYLKYLTQSCLSEEDQLRTHVFSSFFYKRLTTRPVRSARRHHPMELDSSTSPAEKRHARVKSWTKHVDIFDKDFIVIPINESAHWFLAIICFPGLDGCVRMSDGAPVKLPPVPPKPHKKHKETEPQVTESQQAEDKEMENQEMQPQPCIVKPIQIGATTITPITTSSVRASGSVMLTPAVNVDEGEPSSVVDDFSDRDEAEGEEEDIQMPSESEDEGLNEGKIEKEEDKKEPSENVVEKEKSTPEEEKSGNDDEKNTSETEEQDKNKSNEESSTKTSEYCSPHEAIKQPCILIFDSLAGSSRSRVVATLRDYLRIEYKVKKGIEKEFSKDTIRGACPRVPQQTNFVDCGVYVLQYVESFFQNPIKDYRIPIRSLTQWFPEEVAHRKREAIHELIIKLMKEQNITTRLPKITLPSPASRANQPNPQDDKGESLKSVEIDMSKKLREQSQIIIKTDQSGQRIVTGGIRLISVAKLMDGRTKITLDAPNDGSGEQQMKEQVLSEEFDEKRNTLNESKNREDIVERMEIDEDEEEEAFKDKMQALLEEGELEDEGKMDDEESEEEDESQLKTKMEVMKSYSALVLPNVSKRKPLRHDIVIEGKSNESEVSCDSDSPNKRPKC